MPSRREWNVTAADKLRVAGEASKTAVVVYYRIASNFMMKSNVLHTVKDFLPFRDDGYREVQSSLLADDEKDTIQLPLSQQKRRSRLCNFILSLLSLTLVFALGVLVGSRWLEHHANLVCIERTSQKSPITSDLDITYHEQRFNGSLLKENTFRLPAGEVDEDGDDVDMAWASLGVHFRSIAVPASEAQRVGLALDQVKISQRYGGGYPANVEGLHQLHCLNLVRQSLYYNYDFYHSRGLGAFQNSDHIVRKHVSHCLDIVRQQLMCTVDIGVLGQVWFQPASAEFPESYVDFNTKHVCRNFEDVRQWAEERQLPEEIPEDFLEPPREGDRIYLSIP